MKKIKIIAGISWAFLSLIIIIMLFPGLNSFSVAVSKLPFMKIHPRYTGGEVAKEYVTKDYTLSIRKPVFKGLLSDRETGFVQIDWRGNVPETINDTVDYDQDGVPDFSISVDTKQTKSDLVPLNPKVTRLEASTKTSYGWAVRVGLRK